MPFGAVSDKLPAAQHLELAQVPSLELQWDWLPRRNRVERPREGVLLHMPELCWYVGRAVEAGPAGGLAEGPQVYRGGRGGLATKLGAQLRLGCHALAPGVHERRPLTAEACACVARGVDDAAARE